PSDSRLAPPRNPFPARSALTADDAAVERGGVDQPRPKRPATIEPVQHLDMACPWLPMRSDTVHQRKMDPAVRGDAIDVISPHAEIATTGSALSEFVHGFAQVCAVTGSFRGAPA